MTQPTEKPFPWKCGACREKKVYRTTIPYSTEIEYDGGKHAVSVSKLSVPRCENCGRLVFDTEATDQLYDALRAELKLLKPEEIRRHREALNRTQRELAGLLRIHEATLSRWETGGQIQQRGYDQLLRQAFGLDDIRAAVLATKRPSDAPAKEVGAAADGPDELIRRLTQGVGSRRFREQLESELAGRPGLLRRLDELWPDLEEFLPRLFLWLLSMDRASLRGWKQAVAGDPGADVEGRWYIAPVDLHNRADGEYAARLRQFVRLLDERSPEMRKKALRGFAELVELLG